MAAVNRFCLVLAFAFINSYVCIKVDPNGIPNGNYTTISLNSQTIQPYTKSATLVRNEADNFTLLGDTDLSASERTRRLIPYMAFYVPVSELPINKQYASKNTNNNNIHATKQLARPSATGPTGSYIPLPPQYVHSGIQYLPPAPAAAPASQLSSAPSGQQHYHPNAGLGSYHTHGYGGQQPQQQQQFHLLPPATGHSQHLQPPGPPGPSASGLSVLAGHGKGNGNNHNAFVTFKEVNPIRQKTVQHFPPLTSTASSPSSSSSSGSAYENIRQTSSVIKQQQHQQKVHYQSGSGSGSSGNNNNGAAAVYRPRTKQSKINLTPFTPSNTVPGNFVPIVYTPVNSNNNNNNNILNSHATAVGAEAGAEAGEIDDNSYNQDENQQYHKQQHHPHPHHQPQSQQIAIEYSSGPLPTSASAALIPIDVQPVPQRHHHHQQQQQQQQQHNPKQQSQYYSVTTSPQNVDLTHSLVAAGGGTIASGDSVNSAHHHHHQQHHNAEAISPPTIYHQNQHHHQQQQQPEHVIIDASLRTSQQPQTVTGIGSQHQQQQQQLYHGGKSAIQFQPPKPESFFESEIQLQQHHNQHQQHNQQQHNIEQVLKDVNSYSIKNSQMMTPQEKYVMYLQQRMRYNKHQQRQHATRHKYREPGHNKEREQQQYQHQQNTQQDPTQIFVLSSTMSPPPPIHTSPGAGTVTALTPIRPPQPSSHYDPNYPQHSSMHHDLYPRPELKPTASGVGATGGGDEQVLTIPVHSLFGELETLQQQHHHNHYSQSHTASLPSHHKSQYSKNGPPKPQYIDYLIDEPGQSLDDEQQQRQQQHQHQLEFLKPTLGPPTHAFIVVTTAAPFLNEPETQENYASSLRPPYKNKPKVRLQPVLKEKNVNYPTIREQNPTGRPQIVSITPPPKSHGGYNEEDAKYVYVKEEFGQKISAAQGGGVGKLKPSNKYESDDNQIPQQRQQYHQHHHHPQHQQQQNDENMPLQTLATRQPTIHHQQQHHHNEVQPNVADTEIESTPPKTILADPNELPDIRTSSLAEILHKLQESNHLPHTLTPDNIDNSIKTLIRILNNLKQTQTIVANPPQHHEIQAHPHPSSPDYDYTTGSEEDHQQPEQNDLSLLTPTGPNKHPGPSTGRPGIDYPNYAEIPQTAFDCAEQRYKGFFGDPETNCQVWHYCDLNGGKASFLCPNGTIFSQIALTCDWWFNVKCATTSQLYVLNERLYKYILPFTPKFPEDYSGPIVDKYLAMKFQEMEDKMRLEKEKALQEEAEVATETEPPTETVSEDSKENNHLEENTTEYSPNRHVKSHPPAQQHKHESVNSQVSEQSSERNLLIDDEVDDISQRGTVDNFESTTIASLSATIKSEPISFSLKPIIVSSTVGPDYDEEQLQSHENEKRSHGKLIKESAVNKTDTDIEESLESDNVNDSNDGDTEKSVLPAPPTTTSSASNKMQITVEKVDVIEIKPDTDTGHLIRDMLLNSKHTN